MILRVLILKISLGILAIVGIFYLIYLMNKYKKKIIYKNG